MKNKLYWYAVRESQTNKSHILKILSRPMLRKEDAEFHASHIKGLIKRKNPNHTYTAIRM